MRPFAKKVELESFDGLTNSNTRVKTFKTYPLDNIVFYNRSLNDCKLYFIRF
jgi:hypothetical protein